MSRCFSGGAKRSMKPPPPAPVSLPPLAPAARARSYSSSTSLFDTDALRLRFALTDVRPASKPSDANLSVDVGGAALEGEALDATSSQRIVAVIDRIEGSRKGTKEVPEEWRGVEGAFREWAKRLLDYLDEEMR